MRDLAYVSFSFRNSTKVMYPADVAKMLDLDFSERHVNNDAGISQKDQRFITLMRQGIHFEDGHYTMPLPFKEGPPVLPNNKDMALSRLNSLRRKLMKDDTYRAQYQAFMGNLIRNHHAEIVPDAEVQTDDGHGWYIPHHGVYHPKKPGKLRVVFDCSAVQNGQSLNKHLLQGPDDKQPSRRSLSSQDGNHCFHMRH